MLRLPIIDFAKAIDTVSHCNSSVNLNLTLYVDLYCAGSAVFEW